MNHHEDRSPLLLKIALRQSLTRIEAEAENISQYEALAGNLGKNKGTYEMFSPLRRKKACALAQQNTGAEDL